MDERWAIDERGRIRLDDADRARIDERWELDDRSIASSSVADSIGSKSTQSISTNGSIVLPPSKMLVSKKWDLTKFKTPELHWNFYDAYHRSKPVKTARKEALEKQQDYTSVEGANLEIVFKRSILKEGKSALDAFLEATSTDVVSPYPHPLDELIPMQDSEGKWHDLKKVLSLLNLPSSFSLDRATEWEQATAFAIAFIRQRLDLFDLLRDAHDKARGWLGSGEFIYQARELILMATITRSMAHGKELSEADIVEATAVPKLDSGDARHTMEEVEAEECAKFGPKFNVPQIDVDTSTPRAIKSFFLPRPKPTTLSFLQHTLTEDQDAQEVSVPRTSSRSSFGKENSTAIMSETGSWDAHPIIEEEQPVVMSIDAEDPFEPRPPSSSSPTKKKSKRLSVSFSLPPSTPRQDEAEEPVVHPTEQDIILRKVGKFLLPPDSPDFYEHDSAAENRASWGLSVTDQEFKGAEEKKATGEAISIEVSESAAQFDALKSKLQAISPQKDLAKIKSVQGKLQGTQLQLVDVSVKIESHVDELHCVLLDSIKRFNSCETYEERNKSFEQVTAMLGDDYPAREGFKDWRGKGCKGLRPLVLLFFSVVQELAELRLLLEELETPEGRKIQQGSDLPYDKNRYRWRFMYNGVDVVLKVMHCVDFLRKCKEFCNSYGRKFYFTGNPLMLPFNMQVAWQSIPEIQDKVAEQLACRAHVRPMYTFTGDVSSGYGAVSIAPGTDGAEKWAALCENNWRLDKYLGRFKKDVLDLCQSRGFNWPNVPEKQMKSNAYVKQLYTSCLVMFIRQLDSVSSTTEWEKSFIQLTTTSRGANLMIGSSGLKADLQLPLPSNVILRTKNAFLGIFPEREELEAPPASAPATQKVAKKPSSSGGRKSVNAGAGSEGTAPERILTTNSANGAKKASKIDKPPGDLGQLASRVSFSGAGIMEDVSLLSVSVGELSVTVGQSNETAASINFNKSTKVGNAAASSTSLPASTQPRPDPKSGQQARSKQPSPTNVAAAKTDTDATSVGKRDARKGEKKKKKASGTRVGLKDFLGSDVDPSSDPIKAKQALLASAADSNRVSRISVNSGSSMTRRVGGGELLPSIHLKK